MSTQLSLFPQYSFLEEELSPLDEMFATNRLYRNKGEYMKLLNFISSLPKHSAYNCLLLYIQNPKITYIATAEIWENKFRRRPKNEARPLIMLASKSPVLFVYDLKDTEGNPVQPELIRSLDAHRKLHKAIFENTLHNCKIHGIAVREVLMDHHEDGYVIRLTEGKRWQFREQKLDRQMNYLILLNEKINFEEKYCTLAHELGHIFCGHLGVDSNAWWVNRWGTGRTKEIEAESVAFLISRRKELLVNSQKYLTWYTRQDSEMPILSLNAILLAVSYIEDMAKSRWKKPKNKSRYK